MNIDKKDFYYALEQWYWILDEYNDYNNKEFNNILHKYNITIDDMFDFNKKNR